ncbi:BMP family ABC transporter substrate-binding protein [Spiroplasma endosymbiont of Notiophilus biguttatus]|uniref:BMP family ABC transporter substrate-binding protein n=1 Tax=Spiroplasma endosymbiont of Notiophilus biguttatus TaxID=3066285 RepID=UPI00313BD987
MRKIFTAFSSISLSIIMVLPIIACNSQFNNPNIYRITVVTDGHTINDASFNESSYNAALKFKQEFNDWTHSDYVDPQYKNKKVEVSWDNPQLINTDDLMTSYNKAVFINSKVIIASGFLHHNALVKAQNTILKHKVKFIFIDGDTPNKEVPKSNKQLAGLLYKAEQSGFLAGLAGAIWLTAHANQYGGLDNLKMSTYGGLDIPAVTNYMYGYYWAIQFFNNKSKNKEAEEKLISWVKILNSDFKEPLPNIKFITSGTQFSGDFTQGSKGSQAINDDLARQKTNIIFPVAGPQTEDTLSSLKKSGQGKIIGVDTDQQLQYPQSADRFITSAEKDLISSIKLMLWKSVGKTNQNPEHPTDLTADQTFIDDAPYRGGPNFTGIAPNKAIKDGDKDIYTPLMTETTNWLDKISAGWQKVLNLKDDYWINGIKKEYDPFK